MCVNPCCLDRIVFNNLILSYVISGFEKKHKKNEKKSAQKFGGKEKVATFAPAKRKEHHG